MLEVLTGKIFAILSTDGFEESELFVSRDALLNSGAKIEIVSLFGGKIKSWKNGKWGRTIAVDKTIRSAMFSQYDGLVLPGGVVNADTLRADKDAVAFVKKIVELGLPIAAICHGAWILIETKNIKDHKLTSWPSLKTDLENAGAVWIDQNMVSDNGWVTSRMPEDLNFFTAGMIEAFAKGPQNANPVSIQQECG